MSPAATPAAAGLATVADTSRFAVRRASPRRHRRRRALRRPPRRRPHHRDPRAGPQRAILRRRRPEDERRRLRGLGDHGPTLRDGPRRGHPPHPAPAETAYVPRRAFPCRAPACLRRHRLPGIQPRSRQAPQARRFQDRSVRQPPGLGVAPGPRQNDWRGLRPHPVPAALRDRLLHSTRCPRRLRGPPARRPDSAGGRPRSRAPCARHRPHCVGRRAPPRQPPQRSRTSRRRLRHRRRLDRHSADRKFPS